jgi:hypothetical protein
LNSDSRDVGQSPLSENRFRSCPATLLDDRYAKFRAMGQFEIAEGVVQSQAEQHPPRDIGTQITLHRNRVNMFESETLNTSPRSPASRISALQHFHNP